MNDAILRTRLIRLASEHPEFRKDLLPLIASAKSAGCEKLPEGGMRENCEKKKEEGAASKDEEKKEASVKVAHGPVAFSNPAVMLYAIDPEKNQSKFYEIAVMSVADAAVARAPDGGGYTSAKFMKDFRRRTSGSDGFVCLMRWGALTDRGGVTGKVDSMNAYFDTDGEAIRAMGVKKQDKVGGKGSASYTDVSRTREYPIGLTRKPAFGWGEQAACRYVPELRELQELVGSSLRDMGRLNVSVTTLARRDSSMGQKLSPMLSGVLSGLQQMDLYLAGQLRECRE